MMNVVPQGSFSASIPHFYGFPLNYRDLFETQGNRLSGSLKNLQDICKAPEKSIEERTAAFGDVILSMAEFKSTLCDMQKAIPSRAKVIMLTREIAAYSLYILRIGIFLIPTLDRSIYELQASLFQRADKQLSALDIKILELKNLFTREYCNVMFKEAPRLVEEDHEEGSYEINSIYTNFKLDELWTIGHRVESLEDIRVQKDFYSANFQKIKKELEKQKNGFNIWSKRTPKEAGIVLTGLAGAAAIVATILANRKA